MQVTSSFVDSFTAKYPEYFNRKRVFRRIRGSKFNCFDMLEWILDYYFESEVIEDFYDFAYNSEFCANFDQTTSPDDIAPYGEWGAVSIGYKIWQLLAHELSLEGTLIESNYFADLVKYDGVLLEKYDSLPDAVNACEIKKFCKLIDIIPEGAFEDLIVDWAFRASNIGTASLYNDVIDDVRISNHWDSANSNCTINGNLRGDLRWRKGRFSHQEDSRGGILTVFNIETTYDSVLPTPDELVQRYNRLIPMFASNKAKQNELMRIRNAHYAKIKNKTRM